MHGFRKTYKVSATLQTGIPTNIAKSIYEEWKKCTDRKCFALTRKRTTDNSDSDETYNFSTKFWKVLVLNITEKQNTVQSQTPGSKRQKKKRVGEF
jgi:hypothetical protein